MREEVGYKDASHIKAAGGQGLQRELQIYRRSEGRSRLWKCFLKGSLLTSAQGARGQSWTRRAYQPWSWTGPPQDLKGIYKIFARKIPCMQTECVEYLLPNWSMLRAAYKVRMMGCPFTMIKIMNMWVQEGVERERECPRFHVEYNSIQTIPKLLHYLRDLNIHFK